MSEENACVKCGHQRHEHNERGCFKQSSHGSGCCTCGGFVETDDPLRITPPACASCAQNLAALESLKLLTRKDRDLILALKNLLYPPRKTDAAG